MKYKLLKGDRMDTLENEVNELIAQGWNLQGGVVAYSSCMATYYCQAMILGVRDLNETDN